MFLLPPLKLTQVYNSSNKKAKVTGQKYTFLYTGLLSCSPESEHHCCTVPSISYTCAWSSKCTFPMSFWKNKLISLFLVRIWILKKAYNSPYTAARTAVFEAVNLSGMIWAQWFLLAEWNLVSAEHSFVLFLSLRTFCFTKSFSNTKDKFCPKNISVCQKFWIRSLKVWREKKKKMCILMEVK